MTFSETTYRKGILAKWLLRIAILMSAFTFAENSGYSKSFNHPNAQTEIVCKLYAKATKRAGIFRNSLSIKLKENFNYLLNNSWTINLLAYERQTKVRFDNASKLHFLNYKADLFLIIKTITQNSSEDDFISIKG
jgi:hypothetical protein